MFCEAGDVAHGRVLTSPHKTLGSISSTRKKKKKKRQNKLERRRPGDCEAGVITVA